MVATPGLSPAHEAAWLALCGILPGGAVCRARTIRPADVQQLGPQEAAVCRGWVPSRQAEFAAGRLAMRAVTEALGLPPAELLPGPDRVPRWPPGAAFSLTHADGLALAAAAAWPTVRSLGIDLVRCQRFSEGMARQVLHPDERAERGHWPDALYFSAKESLYKAQWGLSRAWMDFHDVVLHIRHGRFEARVVGGQAWPEGTRFEGRWASTADHILTAVSLP
jgi:4'-phosphopantetheinyl transferase EntD